MNQIKLIIISAILLTIPLQSNILASIAFTCFIDAYLSVTIFVATTLILLALIEGLFNFKLNEFNEKNPKYQILVAAALGALPGCGGAIIVLTKYLEKKISFGSVIAALTSTMGDAAFLLISKEPVTGLGIIIALFIIGIITGYIVDFIHGSDFLKTKDTTQENMGEIIHDPLIIAHTNKLSLIKILWLIILIPGIVLGIIKTIYYNIEETNHVINIMIQVVGFTGALLSLISFFTYKHSITENDHVKMSYLHRIINDTNFITFWVICSFLLYSYITQLFNINLELLFNNQKIFLPIIAIIIGFIPGCGPQIIVTTLYLNKMIPLSAQIGNAISNDGDALFPALAMSPKAAIIATLYSSIPAIIVAYLYMFLFE